MICEILHSVQDDIAKVLTRGRIDNQCDRYAGVARYLRKVKDDGPRTTKRTRSSRPV